MQLGWGIEVRDVRPSLSSPLPYGGWGNREVWVSFQVRAVVFVGFLIDVILVCGCNSTINGDYSASYACLDLLQFQK